MKRLLMISLTILIASIMTACGGSGSGDNVEGETIESVKYKVQIDVSCEENLLLNKYDVAVFIDSEEIGVLDHGTHKMFETELEEGTYVITFEKEGGSSVDGSVDIEVSSDILFKYRICCAGSQIEIETIEVLDLSDDARELVTNPSVAYVVECLKHVPSVIGIEVDPESNGADFAGLANSLGRVFFSSNLVDQESVYGDTVLEKGTDGGGSIDIFPSVEEAEKRNDYLAGCEGLFVDPGSHTVVGTIVVRISSELSEEKQDELQASIISVLTSGEIAEPVVYGSSWVAEGSGVKVTPTETAPEKTEETENEVSEPEVEVRFSKEFAKRAAVVAMTNSQATDVFATDGNTYDPSKFHSYNDVSGFYMSIYEEGTWVGKDENTWHVEGLILDIAGYDTYVKASLDVTFDGSNYIVSDVTRVLAQLKYLDSNDASKINVETMEPSDYNPFLTVTPELIENDRDEDVPEEESSSKDSVRTNWIESQFSLWDGAHKELEKLIIKNLNDEKSYKHIETGYIDVCDETMRDYVNGILQNAGVSRKVEIGDLLITTEFSAKNAFGGTVKNTAYGISSYKNNTIYLIDIT